MEGYSTNHCAAKTFSLKKMFLVYQRSVFCYAYSNLSYSHTTHSEQRNVLRLCVRFEVQQGYVLSLLLFLFVSSVNCSLLKLLCYNQVVGWKIGFLVCAQ